MQNDSPHSNRQRLLWQGLVNRIVNLLLACCALCGIHFFFTHKISNQLLHQGASLKLSLLDPSLSNLAVQENGHFIDLRSKEIFYDTYPKTRKSFLLEYP